MTEFNFPKELNGPPPAAHADCYSQSGYRLWTLKPEARAQIAAYEQQLADQTAAFEAQMAELEAEHLRTREKMSDYIVKTEVDKALKQAGAKSSVLHGASALLRSVWRFNVAGDTVTVRDQLDDADHDLGRAVEWWLGSTDEGRAFANPPAPCTEFSDLVRRITEPH